MPPARGHFGANKLSNNANDTYTPYTRFTAYDVKCSGCGKDQHHDLAIHTYGLDSRGYPSVYHARCITCQRPGCLIPKKISTPKYPVERIKREYVGFQHNIDCTQLENAVEVVTNDRWVFNLRRINVQGVIDRAKAANITK
jgi:hypothetical protein